LPFIGTTEKWVKSFEMFPEHRGHTFQQRSIFSLRSPSRATDSGKMQDVASVIHAKCTKAKNCKIDKPLILKGFFISH
jgi:hypothetical protein